MSSKRGRGPVPSLGKEQPHSTRLPRGTKGLRNCEEQSLKQQR
jgi:hypothetical protein